MDSKLMTDLEEMVDKRGLQAVIEELAIVCQSKAEHIRYAWQDGKTAQSWEKLARGLDRQAVRAELEGI